MSGLVYESQYVSQICGPIYKISRFITPRTVTSTFTDQLFDMLDQIMLLGNRFVVVGDFNVPGDVAGQLDPHAVDVLTQYGLRQHVTGSTHISGNTLDLILSRDEQISEQLVSQVAVQSVCFSDHHLDCHCRSQ